jgi:predicted solute-binding protein
VSAAGEPLRIGSVGYLNARPLNRGLGEGPIFDHPSALATRLVAGDLDAALVPAFFALAHPEFPVADGVGIVSDGPVWSVVLAWRGELQGVRSVGLDPASMSSAHLLRVLEPSIFPGPPEYHPRLDPTCDAFLLIGSQAIDFRRTQNASWNYLDLGEAWKRQTGLPFVYALWAIRPDLPQPSQIAENFRAAKRSVAAAIPSIAAGEDDPDFALEYLTRHIRYEIGPLEKAGLDHFRGRLIERGLLGGDLPPPRWV